MRWSIGNQWDVCFDDSDLHHQGEANHKQIYRYLIKHTFVCLCPQLVFRLDPLLYALFHYCVSFASLFALPFVCAVHVVSLRRCGSTWHPTIVHFLCLIRNDCQKDCITGGIVGIRRFESLAVCFFWRCLKTPPRHSPGILLQSPSSIGTGTAAGRTVARKGMMDWEMPSSWWWVSSDEVANYMAADGR